MQAGLKSFLSANEECHLSMQVNLSERFDHR
jgi:hypothetical protein